MKLRVVELLLVVTVPTMFLAAGGVPELSTILLTLLGGTLAAGGANAINQVIDRDIDALMTRTGKRPIVTGEISPAAALAFGIGVSLASVLLLGLTVNWLSAALAGLANLFYVFVYTLGLKRRTPQNIVWGGLAGCFPALIGWSAVTGSLALEPWILFLVIFFWTPPHYWPLSVKFRSDYAAAGVPMLPVVAAPTSVVRQILAYSWAMVAASLLLIPVGPMGLAYSVVAVGAGAWFLAEAHAYGRRVMAGAADTKPMRLFHGSISYLAILFLAVGVDPLLPF